MKRSELQIHEICFGRLHINQNTHMNREEIIKFLKDVVDDESGCSSGCHSTTRTDFDFIRDMWKHIFKSLDEEIDVHEMELELLDLLHSIWEQRERMLKLEGKLRNKRIALENEHLINPPPQYTGANANETRQDQES
jgi:hypothetical protein